jgi:hypothetical protein
MPDLLTYLDTTPAATTAGAAVEKAPLELPEV